MEKIDISWKEIFAKLRPFDTPNIIVYGVPKGGMILAGFLQHAKSTHIAERADLILDDIVDSGATRDHFKKMFPNKSFRALFDRKSCDNRWLVFPWEKDHPGEQSDNIQDNIVRQLQYLGEDPNRDGLKGTPERMVRSWAEIYGGYNVDVSKLFTVFEKDGYDQIVLLRDIELYSTCEHHMLPFYGKAHVAYIPNDKVVGISKLARLVDAYSKRLQIQERICKQVTDALQEHLNPLASACVIEARHMCMCMRGVGKQNSAMVTSSLSGNFLNASAKQELGNLIGLRI